MLEEKGQLSTLAMKVIIALVVLFVGLFMISMVTGITGNLNDSWEVNNETFNATNAVGDYNHTVSHASDGDFVKVKSPQGYNTTAQSTTVPTIVKDAENGEVQLNLSEAVTGSNSTNLSTYLQSLEYEYETESTMSQVHTYLQNQSSVIFKVMILVIIIVALGVAINVLRGWSGEGSRGKAGSPSV